MKSEPPTGYSVVNDGPFYRAHIRVYGRTEDAALEAGRGLREGLALTLSRESTCYPPKYKGFDDDVGRHYAVVIVSLGGDRAAEEARLASFLRQLSSSR